MGLSSCKPHNVTGLSDFETIWKSAITETLPQAATDITIHPLLGLFWVMTWTNIVYEAMLHSSSVMDQARQSTQPWHPHSRNQLSKDHGTYVLILSPWHPSILGPGTCRCPALPQLHREIVISNRKQSPPIHCRRFVDPWPLSLSIGQLLAASKRSAFRSQSEMGCYRRRDRIAFANTDSDVCTQLQLPDLNSCSIPTFCSMICWASKPLCCISRRWVIRRNSRQISLQQTAE